MACNCRHQLTYKIAAISASLGVTSLAILAVHYRFAWHMENGGDVPWAEAAATILLTFGGVVSFDHFQSTALDITVPIMLHLAQENSTFGVSMRLNLRHELLADCFVWCFHALHVQ